MWIRVRPVDGPKISIPVPLVLLKSRWIWRMIGKYSGGNTAVSQYAEMESGTEQSLPVKTDPMQFYPVAREAYSELTRFIRVHGHFTLVEVISSEGDHIKITV